MLEKIVNKAASAAFDHFDKSKNGYLSREELRGALAKMLDLSTSAFAKLAGVHAPPGIGHSLR